MASPEAYKKAWEILALNYAKQSGIDLVNMRLSGTYGPLYRSLLNLPSRLCHAAARGTEPDFSPERGGVPYAEDAQDLTYVKDIARGVVLVQSAKSLEHRTYNIGCGRAISNAEFVEAVSKAKPSSTIAIQPGRGPRYREDAYMDVSRVRSELGFEPRYGHEQAIAEYIEWLERGNTH